MTEPFYTKWLELSTEDKLAVFQETAARKGLPAAIIEKDWWVCIALRIIFNMDVAPHLLFKGGTSLSKGWNLIDRFSEDVDIILDRDFLGFQGTLNNTEVNKLRRANKKFITTEFLGKLETAFKEFGVDNIKMSIAERSISLGDPIQININYQSITEKNKYIFPRVQVEIGSRSLKDPSTKRDITSFVGVEFEERDFVDSKFSISCINPERTFLEKIFLLHEEFQKSKEKISAERKSRHFYDLYKIMDTEFADIALGDNELYNDIIKNREKFYKVSGINYNKHHPRSISLIPSENIYSDWENDYNFMRENMIYKESPSFEDLMKMIKALQDRINQIQL